MKFLESAKKNKTLLIGESKNKLIRLGKVYNALNKFDKKENKNTQKSIKKVLKDNKKNIEVFLNDKNKNIEVEEMKKISITNLIMIFTSLIGMFIGYRSFSSAQQSQAKDQAKAFQKLVSGQSSISKNQTKLIRLTEKISDKQSDLRVEVAKVKGQTEVNKAIINTLNKSKNYRTKRRR